MASVGGFSRPDLFVRIIHTIASTRLDHGGTSRSVPALCEAIGRLGVDVHLVAGCPADESIPCGWPRQHVTVHAVQESSLARSWGISDKFRRILASLCSGEAPTLIHDHGLWLATNHATAAFARSHNCPRVVSPRGMLSHWAMGNGRLKKGVAWPAYQRRDLASAAAFHATSESEAADIRELCFKQPIAVIPNGVRFPSNLTPALPADGRRRVLFLSRIHRKKGLLNLVHAWQRAAPSHEWELLIAGPDEGCHRSEVERAVRELEIDAQVHFPGEISDGDKWKWLNSAEVVVLPSFSENFGLIVAEALIAGKPVLTTTGTPWAEVSRLEFGWQVSPTVPALSDALKQITMTSAEALREKGRRAAEWARTLFTWERAAKQMLTLYEIMAGDSTKACEPFIV